MSCKSCAGTVDGEKTCPVKCSYNWNTGEGCAKVKKRRTKPTFRREKVIDDTTCEQFNVCINGQSYPLFMDIEIAQEVPYKKLTNICV